MRFWGTSALVPLLFEQESTARIREILDQDPEMVAWWGTPVECASAAARLRREGVITVDEEDAVLRLLGDLRESLIQILPFQDVRGEAMRLLRVHSLKAADALQLGAAILWAGPDRGSWFLTLDERLGLAARLEGFRIQPGTHPSAPRFAGSRRRLAGPEAVRSGSVASSRSFLPLLLCPSQPQAEPASASIDGFQGGGRMELEVTGEGWGERPRARR